MGHVTWQSKVTHLRPQPTYNFFQIHDNISIIMENSDIQTILDEVDRKKKKIRSVVSMIAWCITFVVLLVLFYNPSLIDISNAIYLTCLNNLSILQG